MILQLNPQIPLVTNKGPAQAIFLIDYSEEHNLYFVCIMDETGEIWTFSNQEVRAFENVTMGRIFKQQEVPSQLFKDSRRENAGFSFYLEKEKSRKKKK